VPERSVAAKELLTAKEVEELLRIDVKTIYNYVQRGLIPYVRMQSNLRFFRSEILAFGRGTQKPAADLRTEDESDEANDQCRRVLASRESATW